MKTIARRLGLFSAQALFLLVASAHVAPPAEAHAVLVDSTPKENAILPFSPQHAVLRFNARIEKGVSRITLETVSGRKLPIPPMPRGFKGGGADSLIVMLPKLDPGNYRLIYRVLATDGHATPGQIHFTITGRGK